MIEKTGDDVVVIADRPQEMVEAQHATIAVVGGKLERARAELADAQETVLAVQGAGLNDAAANRIAKAAESRVTFLDKVKQALEAGYVIVPEMPSDVIAIRVKRDAPRPQYHRSDHGYTPSINVERAPALPAGEGEYVDPVPPTVTQRQQVDDGKGGKLTRVERYTTGEWDTDLALPVNFLRPTVVERTGKMMTRKIFDEIAVIGASRSFSRGRGRRVDPMVVGSVVDRATKRRVWFLAAWFVDTRDI